MRVADLTPDQGAELDVLASMSDADIDTSDIPATKELSNPRRGVFSDSPNIKASPKSEPGLPSQSSNGKGTTDTSEHGLEDIIFASMTGAGWIPGKSADYHPEHCVDLAHLSAFLKETQPEIAKSLMLDTDNPTRRKFLARLKVQIASQGVVKILRGGVKRDPHDISLFYATPTPGNEKAAALYSKNRFSITRQLHYSKTNPNLSLDLAIFINGLSVATFELKNSLTKQTVTDAVTQYERDRSPREDLFKLGRCLAHFAVDDQEVQFCTELKGNASRFLPFNKGRDGGAGNPVNPEGLMTDYLWRETLTPENLTDILENYTQLIQEMDRKTRKKSRTQIWPRYHQLDVVRKLLAHAQENGVGKRYLVQHSAGSGKSNSIAWLVKRLVGLERKDETVFDSIIVVNHRTLLDRQTHDTFMQFMPIRAIVGHAESSSDLREFIAGGKKVIISTVQKFPFILDEIAEVSKERRFAIIIDEAHSHQGGRTSSKMSQALGLSDDDDEGDTLEDKINRIVESKKMLSNASYFAFTATPKNKTLELFGEPATQPDGTTKYLPFHSYTMKQAIEERFILDVLGSYTPVDSYYNLVKKVEDDPEFDSKRAQRKLRRYVENHEHAIRLKSEIMVDHFIENVITPRKIGGQARAMVVTDGIQQAMSYYHAIKDYLAERGTQYKAIVAFSGEHYYGDAKVSEASLNGFPSNSIVEKIQEDPYRILVCADKFQTGYDEQLLHTMYVDKMLSGIKAVQTLSRLNRSHPKKHDTFVLDFKNDSDTIQEAFSDYYKTTILSDETDPDKLHDLKATLDDCEVYSDEQVDDFVEKYLDGADRDQLDPLLDSCVETYRNELGEDGQVDFKGAAKGFVRAYAFLVQILPHKNIEWEKLSIFLNYLIPKLPAPIEEDMSKGILEVIDMESYRVEKQTAQKIMLDDGDAEIDPASASGGGYLPETDMTLLSVILNEFNNRFGTEFTDADQVGELIVKIPELVKANDAYHNVLLANTDPDNARVEHDRALDQVLVKMIQCSAELYKFYSENETFRHWLQNRSFTETYDKPLLPRV